MASGLRTLMLSDQRIHVAVAACRKRRYPTKLAAWDALDRLADKPRKPGEKVETRAYRCGRCKGWHLTSSAHRKDMR